MTRERYQAICSWFNARPAVRTALRAVNGGAVAAVYALYIGLLIWLAWQRQVLFWGVLCVPAAAFCSGTLLRAAIDRPRPYAALGFVPLFPKAVQGQSMPSRHCFCAAAIAVAAAAVSAPLGVLAAVLAVLIAAGRVLAGVHWPSDVLAGLAFGAAVGAAGFAVFYTVIG